MHNSNMVDVSECTHFGTITKLEFVRLFAFRRHDYQNYQLLSYALIIVLSFNENEAQAVPPLLSKQPSHV